jgi:biotin carboxyl carrier protein
MAVKEGDAVNPGDTVVVIEAMKMEHCLTSALDGTVKEINVSQGDQVEDGDILVVLEPKEDS